MGGGWLVGGWILMVVMVKQCQSDYTSNLKLVNLVYRHGDRSPIDVYKGDPNGKDNWPDGMGWLSKIGMNQHYRLGQWLRDRYNGFLSSDYIHTEIVVTSSDEDRCLMSAASNLAGLYPPTGDQVWNSNITWQPIPIHTKPKYEDNRINMGETCPSYTEQYDKDMRSPSIAAIDKANKEFYQFLSNKTGWGPLNITSIWKISDLFVCEKAHGMNWTTWANETWKNEKITVYEKLRYLDDIAFRLLFSGPKSRLKGGPLLKEIIENMWHRLKGETQPKLYMHSGHDTTVAALLTALGLYDHGKSPPYAAMVAVELRENTTAQPHNYFVNVWYKNTTETDTAYKLTIPGCTTDCPYDTFLNLTKDKIPTDWNKECGLADNSGKAKKNILNMPTIVSIVLGSLLLVSLIALVVTCVRARKGNGGFRKFEDFNT
ncbi:lysosomal acid phosphatase-like isoform X2 [Mizuhopecten yessoensis]|uniref:acid phosphatase n=1 Tax=Mizuhopecten yessoensis TaxID=6573 RepID=A0A210PVE4_MIZYE|nr:lysosomal acid phosphatase-like isoform X2 [Mizuhopecten yessoensis]OWF40461.1 Lysosomal acid phosphatase [Mizuhopecten yessoensis]